MVCRQLAVEGGKDTADGLAGLLHPLEVHLLTPQPGVLPTKAGGDRELRQYLLAQRIVGGYGALTVTVRVVKVGGLREVGIAGVGISRLFLVPVDGIVDVGIGEPGLHGDLRKGQAEVELDGVDTVVGLVTEGVEQMVGIVGSAIVDGYVGMAVHDRSALARLIIEVVGEAREAVWLSKLPVAIGGEAVGVHLADGRETGDGGGGVFLDVRAESGEGGIVDAEAHEPLVGDAVEAHALAVGEHGARLPP